MPVARLDDSRWTGIARICRAARGAAAVAALAQLMCAFGTAAAVAAQEPATLRGNLIGIEGRALSGAEVALAGLDIRAVTDRYGRFELRRIPPGLHTLRIEHIGYVTVAQPLVFMPGVVLDHEIRLQAEALPGDTLQVAARAHLGISPQLQGFHDRRARVQGFFFDRQEIQQMGARQFTDVLRRVPGMRIDPVSGPYGTSYVVQMGRATGTSGSRECPVLFFLNGSPFAVSAETGINMFVRPDDVAAVEVYSGASQLPPQFSSTANNSRCGVVVIWTYHGRDDPPRARLPR